MARTTTLAVQTLLLLSAAAFIPGCKSCPKAQKTAALPIIEAAYTSSPLVIDGKLDEEVWKHAVAYPMKAPMDRLAESGNLQDGGKIRLAWDEKFFYVGFELTDSDVVAEGTEDHLLHYNFGDVGELFLKPEGYSGYWELYVTPAAKMSTFWFPGRGLLGLPSCFKNYHFDMKVGAQVQGTLNKWEDKDTGWTSEMAIPVSELTARGESFGPQSQWRILVSRYNYSRYSKFTGPEYSVLPQLSKTNYHLLEEYAQLRLADKN